MYREPQFKGRITGINNNSVCQGHSRSEQFEKMEFFNFFKKVLREKEFPEGDNEGKIPLTYESARL